MKKKWIIIASVIVLAIIAYLYYLLFMGGILELRIYYFFNQFRTFNIEEVYPIKNFVNNPMDYEVTLINYSFKLGREEILLKEEEKILFIEGIKKLKMKLTAQDLMLGETMYEFKIENKKEQLMFRINSDKCSISNKYRLLGYDVYQTAGNDISYFEQLYLPYKRE